MDDQDFLVSQDGLTPDPQDLVEEELRSHMEESLQYESYVEPPTNSSTTCTTEKPLPIIYLGIIGCAGRTPDELKKLNKGLYDRAVEQVKYVIQEILRVSPAQIVLVSGGSAWFDHLVVRLDLEQTVDTLTEEIDPQTGQWLDSPYPNFRDVEIYLPCKRSTTTTIGASSSSSSSSSSSFFDTKSQTGARLHQLHRTFGSAIGRDTEHDLECLRLLGRTIHESQKDNFFARNAAVAARCTHVIAFSWNKTIHEDKKTGAILTGAPSEGVSRAVGSLATGAPSPDGGTAFTWSKCAHAERYLCPLEWLSDDTKTTSQRMIHVKKSHPPQPLRFSPFSMMPPPPPSRKRKAKLNEDGKSHDTSKQKTNSKT